MITDIMRKLAAAAACLLIYMLTFAAAASAQTSALTGKVIGRDGQPLKGAMILIERTDIRGHYKVKTNKKGSYFHAGLPLGTYTVKCEVEGKIADQIRGVRLHLGDPEEINFDLAALAKKQAALRKAAATGQLTAEQTAGMTAEQKAALKQQMEKRTKTMQKNKALNDAFNAAMTAKKARQWDVAVENFEKAATIDPAQTVVWAQLADACVQGSRTKTGDARQALLDKGMTAYQKVIELKPEDPAYHNNYGLALAQAGKMPEAEAELNKAAELNPEHAGQYYYNLGAVMINIGQTEAATEAFRKATEIDPTYANAFYQLGMQLLAQAKLGADGSMVAPDGTKEALQKYLELEPNGQFAPSAQGALQAMNATVQTQYENPNAKKKKTRKK